MQPPINKVLIKKRFTRSLETYDKYALPQKEMALFLIKKLIEEKGNCFNKIIEIGYGTGFLTNEISQKVIFKELYLNDIIENPIEQDSNISILTGDAETIEFPKELDLIISNATFQWMENLEKFFNKAFNTLNNNGILAFTTFGKNNIKEISSITGINLEYKSTDELINILNKDFNIIYSHSEEILLEFETPIEVLKHLKYTGVNSLNENFWTKKDFKHFEKEYLLKYSQNNKVQLTYNPIYIIVQKKNS